MISKSSWPKNKKARYLIKQCLDEDPDRRPTIHAVAKTMGESLGMEWDDGYGVLL
jgi:hypothetical protein